MLKKAGQTCIDLSDVMERLEAKTLNHTSGNRSKTVHLQYRIPDKRPRILAIENQEDYSKLSPEQIRKIVNQMSQSLSSLAKDNREKHQNLLKDRKNLEDVIKKNLQRIDDLTDI
jgi:uncharacterized protein YeeX (DUF496 family)